LQSVIDDLYGRFLEVVQSGRQNLSPEQVQTLADGRIYSASQALENGLVDEIGTLEASLIAAQERAGLQTARVVTYHRPREHANNYYTRPPEHRSSDLIDLWRDALPFRGPAFLYLWSPGLGID